MIATLERKRISLRVRDTSRQKFAQVDDVPADASVGELVQALVTSRINLPHEDAEGRPLNYHARLEREGRHLHASEVVGEVLQDEDEVVLQPQIMAG